MINKTQKFVFETDSLKSLLTVLGTIIPITLGPNDKYSHLQIKKEQPLGYEDGKYGSNHWAREIPVVACKQNEYVLIKPSHRYNGTLFNKVIETFNDRDSAAKKSNQLFDELPKPLARRKWLTTLTNYPKNSEDAVKCASYEDMISKTETIITNLFETRKQELIRDCENIYSDLSGSTGAGFRVEHGGFNEFHISLIFIYYGK